MHTPDWRGLLTELGIEWIDRGPNVGRDNINIRCPNCSDPSKHLGIRLDDSRFHCWICKFSGGPRGSAWLLKRLVPDRSHAQLEELLSRYRIRHTQITAPTTPPVVNRHLEEQWKQFELADRSQRCCDYLRARGFTNPAYVCRQYNLRFAPYGYWSGRLLFPITDLGGKVVAWTGRALLSRLDQRYKMPKDCPPGIIYRPTTTRSVALVVEGPIDALKVASACEGWPVMPIALLGLKVQDVIRNLVDAMHHCQTVFVRLDRDRDDAPQHITISSGQRLSGPRYAEIYHNLQNELAYRLRERYAARLPFPPEFEDLGAMPEPAIRDWMGPILEAEEKRCLIAPPSA